MAADHISFLRNGKLIEYRGSDPMRTVLDYLRLEEKSRGTKEGCNEGDCGACTIALGSAHNGQMHYQPANACILLMGHLHGKELVTVDDLAQAGVLHPVQKSLVEEHSSQCGFCTPGFVMALFTLYQQGKPPSRQAIIEHIAGNLCRCTGYRPIVDAAQKSIVGPAADLWAKNGAATAALLATLGAAEDIFIGSATHFAAIPTASTTLLSLIHDHPDATIVAGATDVGLWITKQLRVLPKLIYLAGIPELHLIADHKSHLSLGAVVSYASAENSLTKLHPDLGTIMRRIGSTQVRTSGTIGGNIANGSPIGDMPPMLIALGATLHLRSVNAERTMPLDDYFIAYGKQDRLPGELVWQIDIPKLRSNETFHAFKISKRQDQDISACLGAFKFTILDGQIASARIAFGGMAAIPRRAAQTEAALLQIDLRDDQTWEKAYAALGSDFQPVSDMRASADYRSDVALALLQKALRAASGEAAGTFTLFAQTAGAV